MSINIHQSDINKSVNIHAGWLPECPIIGTLYIEKNYDTGHNVYSFEYSEGWIINYPSVFLDPDLATKTGRQGVPEGKIIWNFLSDCGAGAFGRKLLNIYYGRALEEIDYIISSNDISRRGGLLFKYQNDVSFIRDEIVSKEIAPVTTELISSTQNLLKEIKNTNDKNSVKELLTLPGILNSRISTSFVTLNSENFPYVLFFDDNESSNIKFFIGILMFRCKISVINCGKPTKDNCFYFRRYDRTSDGERIHIASAKYLINVTEGEKELAFIDIVDFITKHGSNSLEDLQELWKRQVFNTCLTGYEGNAGDCEFILDKNGWHLAPCLPTAYLPLKNDITIPYFLNKSERLNNLIRNSVYYGFSHDTALNTVNNIITTIEEERQSLLSNSDFHGYILPKEKKYLLEILSTKAIPDADLRNYIKPLAKSKRTLSYNLINISFKAGIQIKKARVRRKINAELIAERAGITRATLVSIEKGDPTVAFGAYLSVLHALGLEEDILLIAKDEGLERTLDSLGAETKMRAPKQKKIKSNNIKSSY